MWPASRNFRISIITVETPAQDRGGRESKSHPHNNLPPSVLLAGETAYPTLVSWHFGGRRPIRDRARDNHRRYIFTCWWRWDGSGCPPGRGKNPFGRRSSAEDAVCRPGG